MISRRSFFLTLPVVTLFGCKGKSKASPPLELLPPLRPWSNLTDYFPDRIHEFVWRNWNLVELAKLAGITGASVAEVTSIAESMGLPPPIGVSPEMRERGYDTLIQRNWHLLPYDQLLQLMEMTPGQLAFVLHQDDMLWVKLGWFKPQCEPLRYRPPDEAARRHAAEIRRTVEKDFGEEIARPAEPRFHFIRELSVPMASSSTGSGASQRFPLRIVYPYGAVYGDPLLNPKLNPASDGLLERLAAEGNNAIWLQGLLRTLAPGRTTFPEFGAGCEIRLANLRSLVKRAARYGIDVYLYFNEPRAMPDAFFKTRPQLAGVHEDGYTALCTSTSAVRAWMSDALAYIFSNVPELAGVYTITASESLTNCASHGHWRECPRCKYRTYTEIISQVLATQESGVHRGNPKANVIASDWGWRNNEVTPGIIPRLPKSVWLCSVSEWGKPFERGGIKDKVNEYSISVVGPGPRAPRQWATAKGAGLKTVAEIQFNNTSGPATLPYLSVPNLVASHFHNLAPIQLDGTLIGWTMGGYPSPNFQVAREMLRKPDSTMDEALDAVARGRFGLEGGPHARKAWTLMCDAFRQYPFDIKVVYTSPINIGPANPLYANKTGKHATMWGFPYDDLDSWRGPYPPEIFAAQLEKTAEGWQQGVAELELAVQKAPPDRRETVQGDLRFAVAAGILFKSVANQTHFILARDALEKSPNGLLPGEGIRLRTEIKRSLESEIALARQLFTLAQEDSRIGFEPATQYFYLPQDLVEKVINCRWLLAHFEKQELG